MSDVAPPLAEGRYVLLAVLGRGGTATVYRAQDATNGAQVAVKVLDPKRARDETIRRRFLREARTMAGLRHPNIVTVSDSGEDAGRMYLVMELMRGSSLARGLRKFGAMSERAAAEVMAQVLLGLQAAHDQNVVHRDLKPGNVLLTERAVPKLADFGIARVFDATHLTGTNAVMGSWPYMAPEQRIDARDVDHRADVFSAGATLYALVTHQEPKDIYVPQRQPEMFGALSSPLVQVVRRAVDRRREGRFASADEMRAALAAVLPSLRTEKPPAPTAGSVKDAHTFDMDSLDD